MLFAKPILYIRVFHDRIDIRNVKTNKEVCYTVTQEYSNKKTLIENFRIFEQELKKAIALIQPKKRINRSLIILFQPISESVTNYSESEKNGFRDTCVQVGAAKYYLLRGKDKLTNQTILEGMNNF